MLLNSTLGCILLSQSYNSISNVNSCHRSRRRKILGTARWSPIKQAVLFPEDCIPKYEGRKTLITCLSWLKQIPGYTRPRRNHHTHHQAHDQLLAKHLLTTPHWSWNKWEQNLTEQDFPTSSAAKKLVQRNMLQPNLFSFSTLWKEGGHSKDAAPGGGGGRKNHCVTWPSLLKGLKIFIGKSLRRLVWVCGQFKEYQWQRNQNLIFRWILATNYKVQWVNQLLRPSLWLFKTNKIFASTGCHTFYNDRL